MGNSVLLSFNKKVFAIAALDSKEAFTHGMKVYFCHVYLEPNLIQHSNFSINRKGVVLTRRTGGRGYLGNISVGVLGFLLPVYLFDM